MRCRTVFLAALLWCAAPVAAFAVEVPSAPEGYVNDYAGLLSSDARARLESKLGAFEKETSNQVVVAVFPDLDGGSLEDFSIRLAERWKIGSAKNDNGVILLVFKNDRQVRIEVGYGLEGTLPDATAFDIVQNVIVPRFRSGDFDGGVEAGVEAIAAATRGEYRAEPAGDPIEKYKVPVFLGIVLFFVAPYLLYAAILFIFAGAAGIPGGVGAIVLIVIIEVLRRLIFSARARDYAGRSHGIWGGGGFGGGSGGFGGGFGGGGGGSFGGGGASGRW
jgi:uncharacterized protein